MRAGWIGSASAVEQLGVARRGLAAPSAWQVLDPGLPGREVGAARAPPRGRGGPRTGRPTPSRRAPACRATWPGESATCTTRAGAALVLAAEHAVPEPEVERGADDDDQVGAVERPAAGLGHQQRVAAGHDAAAHAVGDRRDAERLDEIAARPRSAPSAQTSVPRIRTGRSASPSSAADRARSRRCRARRRGARDPVGHGRRGLVEELVHRDVDEHRPAVRASRRAGRPRRSPAVTSAAVGMVRALLVIEATIGGWSSSWRLPLPQRFCGARPPTTTIGDPANCACAIALTPLVTPGPGGEHGQPGHPGQLAGRLGGERRGLLVADVEDPHRRVGLDRAVVHREDVGAGQREHGLHAVRPGDGHGQLAGVAARRVAGLGLAHEGRLPTGHLRAGGTARCVAAQGGDQLEQQVGADVDRLGSAARPGGASARRNASGLRGGRGRGRGRWAPVAVGRRGQPGQPGLDDPQRHESRRSTAMVASASRSGSPLVSGAGVSAAAPGRRSRRAAPSAR